LSPIGTTTASTPFFSNHGLQAVYPTIQAELFPAAVRVFGIGLSHQVADRVMRQSHRRCGWATTEDGGEPGRGRASRPTRVEGLTDHCCS